jgi:membrane protease YdiL (CAAX protease family)
LPEFESAIKTSLPQGWYQDHALFELYEVGKEKKKLAEYVAAVDESNVATIIKVGVFFLIYAIAALIGAVNLLIQLGLIARRGQPAPDAVRLDVPLKTLLAVFVGWFSAYLMLSTLAHLVIAQFPGITKQPNLVAFSTAVSYIVSNISAPLLIYFLVLKPQNISFFEGLRLKMRTSTAGPIKIVFSGLLAWCTAIPLVLLALLIATQYLGTGRSDNPVIGQIVQAAAAANPIAIMLFYLTLGVLAPFFEEILFRGFLYGSLKPRIGTPLALLASAGLFALIHFDKGGVLMLFAIGFVLAYTFEKTRSLVPSMIAHGLWNSGSFTLVLLLLS